MPPELWGDIPAVCFDEDITLVLKVRLRTLQKIRRAGAFPIPELPRLDKRHRYSRRDVIAFLERDDSGRSAAFRRKSA